MAQDNRFDDMSLEEVFGGLEDLLSQMEDNQLSLEDTFAKYEEGMKYIAACSDKIDRVEKKLQILQSDGSVTEQ